MNQDNAMNAPRSLSLPALETVYDLLASTIDQVGPAHQVVLTVARGRLILRSTMPQPDAASLALWFSVFEHALREAGRLGSEWRHAAGGGLTTQPAAWSHSELVRT